MFNVDNQQDPSVYHGELCSMLYRSLDGRGVWGRMCVCICVCVCVWDTFSRVWLFMSPLTVAHQAPLSMEFSRQEYWSGLPFPTPGDLPDPETEPTSLMSPPLAGRFFTTSTTWEALIWGRMDSCICMVESLCCLPETITTLLIGYILI